MKNHTAIWALALTTAASGLVAAPAMAQGTPPSTPEAAQAQGQPGVAQYPSDGAEFKSLNQYRVIDVNAQLQLAREAIRNCNGTNFHAALEGYKGLDELALRAGFSRGGLYDPGPEGAEDAAAIKKLSEQLKKEWNAAQPCGKRKLEVSVAVVEYSLEPAGIGFVSNGLEEEYAGLAPRRNSFFSGAFTTHITDRASIFGEFGSTELFGDNRNAIDVQAGGTSGIVYGAPAPSGSTGVATPFGLIGDASSDITIFGFGASYVILSYAPGAFPSNSTGINLFLNYSHRDHDYGASISGSGSSGGFLFTFSQEREQSINEDLYEVGVKAEYALPLAEKFSLEIFGAASVYRRESELHSTEHNVSNFGPPADQDFTTVIDEDDGGWGAHGQAGAMFSWNFTRAIAIKFGGSVDYRTNVATIFNPNSGDQVLAGQSTTLDTHRAWIWQAGVGIAVALGR